MHRITWCTRGVLASVLCLQLSIAQAQADPGSRRGGSPGVGDPGIRGGALGAGGALPGLSPDDLGKFAHFKDVFEEIETVAEGFGPRFNGDSCGGCHSQPSTGGTSPAVNPQFAAAAREGAHNAIPSFLSQTGPIREVRRRGSRNGPRASQVVQLFTVTGRSDANGCVLAQPDFSNVRRFSFRIPTPVFGAGLVEAISARTLFENLRRDGARKAAFGIGGQLNFDPQSRTVGRFGWKAQVASLLSFSAEAYNVEMGVTSALFPNQGETACGTPAEPEDRVDPATGAPADVEKFAVFMRLANQPQPAAATPSTQNGRNVFDQAGCSLCHTPSLPTGAADTPALASQQVNLFSDLALHSMGFGLADGMAQGRAGGSDFRTAPLWGLGQRLFFLHDGRTSNLVDAIQAHASRGSEANRSIATFNALAREQKQDLLNFLRSL